MQFLDYIAESFPLFLAGSWVTLKLTAAALLMAMVAGALVAAMRMSRFRTLRWLAVGFIGVIRGTPLLTQMFILYFGLTTLFLLSGFWAAAIGLAAHNSAYVAEIFRSGFQSVPNGLVEAGRSLGMSRVQTVQKVQGPLAVRTILPVMASQFIIALKDSSIAAFLTVEEIFDTARKLSASTYEPLQFYVIAAAYYLVAVLALTALVSSLEHRLSAHRR